MKRRHHPGKIVHKLRLAGRIPGDGHSMVEVLKEVEGENQGLKWILADQAVDIDVLTEVNRGIFIA